MFVVMPMISFPALQVDEPTVEAFVDEQAMPTDAEPVFAVNESEPFAISAYDETAALPSAGFPPEMNPLANHPCCSGVTH